MWQTPIGGRLDEIKTRVRTSCGSTVLLDRALSMPKRGKDSCACNNRSAHSNQHLPEYARCLIVGQPKSHVF